MSLSITDTLWILGAGRFGTLAARRLSQKVPPHQIRVVDHRADRLGSLPQGVVTVVGDAVDYLAVHLGRGRDPDWIVPAVPVHVAWELVRRRLSGDGRLAAAPPDAALLASLPNAMTGAGGAIYTSIAGFLCPDNCPEPADRCTHTGLPRPMDLFRAIAGIAGPGWTSVVIRSLQLAPGVGGYRPKALMDALAQVGAARRPLVLATGCRCHGVLHCLGRPGDASSPAAG